VLVQLDTEQSHDQLVNSRLAYVSVSHGGYDARPRQSGRTVILRGSNLTYCTILEPYQIFKLHCSVVANPSAK